jgi:hypothetical protein
MFAHPAGGEVFLGDADPPLAFHRESVSGIPDRLGSLPLARFNDLP